jgi:hypothetical protein
MTDAVPQYLDPALGATPPRSPGLRAGDYPQQANAAVLTQWTIGVSTRAIRQPFGDAVGAPLHYEYDLCPTNLVAVDCRGDPENPDDRSVVQIAQDNPPQAGRVFTAWFWFDWLHNTASASAYFNKSLATKTANAYLGQQARAGTTRPCLAVSGMSPNGGTYLTSLANITIVAPGSATAPGLDCPLVAEDGSAVAPVPLRVPCWVGRWGFRGAVGQVLAGGGANQNFGFFLKIKPLALSFVEDAANLKIGFTAATAEYGCEVYGACAYTLVLLDGPNNYLAPDFNQAGWPCVVYSQQRCWVTNQYTAAIQLFLTPLGDAWQAVLTIQQVLMVRSSTGERYCWPGMHGTPYYNGIASFQFSKPADQVSATPVGIGTSTIIAKTLFNGEAALTVEIAVSATGTVTKCEARITRNVPVGNLGPGWHDRFIKL